MGVGERRHGGCGHEISIVPLAHGDVATVLRVFDGLSADSRYLRFLTAMPRLPRSFIDVLARPDGVRHVALVAWTGGTPVGIGRYIRESPQEAEIAVEVVDRWTGRGIGTQLLRALRNHASSLGVSSFRFSLAPENRRLISALAREGATLSSVGSSLEGVLALGPERHRASRPGAELVDCPPRAPDRRRVAPVARGASRARTPPSPARALQ